MLTAAAAAGVVQRELLLLFTSVGASINHLFRKMKISNNTHLFKELLLKRETLGSTLPLFTVLQLLCCIFFAKHTVSLLQMSTFSVWHSFTASRMLGIILIVPEGKFSDSYLQLFQP